MVVILLFVVSGSGFVFFRRYLSIRPDEVPRLYRLLDLVHEGCCGYGPIHA